MTNYRNGYLQLGAPQTTSPQFNLTELVTNINVNPSGSTPVGTILLTSDDVASNRSFTLSNAQILAQTVTILFLGSNGALLETGGNADLANGDWEGSEGASITVQWNGTAWNELSRNNLPAGGLPVASSANYMLLTDDSGTWNALTTTGAITFNGNDGVNTLGVNTVGESNLQDSCISELKLQQNIINQVQFKDTIIASRTAMSTLDSTVITTLSSGQTIIDASAEDLGWVILVDAIMLWFIPGGTPFTGGSNLELKYGTTGDVIATFPASMITSAVDTSAYANPVFISSGSSVGLEFLAQDANPVVLSVSGADFAAGDGSLYYQVDYHRRQIPG